MRAPLQTHSLVTNYSLVLPIRPLNSWGYMYVKNSFSLENLGPLAVRGDDAKLVERNKVYFLPAAASAAFLASAVR